MRKIDKRFMNHSQHLYVPTEVAKILGRPMREIYSWTNRGVFPLGSVFQHGARVYYTEAAIEAGLGWIRSSIQTLRPQWATGV